MTASWVHFLIEFAYLYIFSTNKQILIHSLEFFSTAVKTLKEEIKRVFFVCLFDSMMEYLLSMQEALGSAPSIEKEKRKQNKNKKTKK